MKQKTLTQEVSWKGKGLHSGADAAIRILPADENHGIRLKKADAEKVPAVKLDPKWISSTNRSTNMVYKEQQFNTLEHILAGLRLTGITNATISFQSDEAPIMDGSAATFVKALAENIAEQNEEQDCFVITEPLFYQDPSGAEYIALPSPDFEVACYVHFDQYGCGNQFANYKSGDDIEKISSAKTFVFASDLKSLVQADLIKGGSLDNAIIIKDKDFNEDELAEAVSKLGYDVSTVLTQVVDFEALEDDVLARHKILDFIGDITLLGVPVQGKFIIRKPGHTGNSGFVKFLKEKYNVVLKEKGIPIYDPNIAPIMDTEEIKSYLPHRYPFMLVDKIIALTDKVVVGVKNITFNENFFTGHFPDNPIFPGVLQMEALAQTGGLLALRTVDTPSNWDTYFLKMDNVKFKRKVVPGDSLILKMELSAPIRRGIVQMKGTCYVGKHVVSEGDLTAQIIDRTKHT